MLHISDAMVEVAVDRQAAQRVLSSAFRDYAAGTAAMQRRVRTESSGVKLSTLGAVLPGQDVVGAKVYTTLQGRFAFVILLFSAVDGAPLATLDAGALTRLRTAACSTLAAQRLARADAASLGLFGAGVQGTEHAIQLAQAFPIREIRVNDPYAPADLVERLERASGVPVHRSEPDDIAEACDIVVTTSRSTQPLFDGMRLRSGAFVAAAGSSLPHTRELDDHVLSRAEAVIVEWRDQALEEAGDLILAAPSALEGKLHELGPLLADEGPMRRSADDIFVYKSVGVGLEDIALAGYAYQQVARERDLRLA